MAQFREERLAILAQTILDIICKDFFFSAFFCFIAFQLTRCYMVFALLQSITDYRELAFRMGRFYKNIPSNNKQDEGPRASVLDSLQQQKFAVEKCSFFSKNQSAIFKVSLMSPLFFWCIIHCKTDKLPKTYLAITNPFTFQTNECFMNVSYCKLGSSCKKEKEKKKNEI